MTRLDFEMEQYRSLRAEILRAMEDANQIMSFGLAAIGVTLGTVVSARDTFFGFLVFAVVVPGLGLLVLSLWFAAQERVARASYFLSGVENRVIPELDGKGPSWEHWLRGDHKKFGRSQHFWNTEYSGIGLLAFLSVLPWFGSMSMGGTLTLRVRATVVVGGILVFGFFAVVFRQRVARWKRWLSETFPK